MRPCLLYVGTEAGMFTLRWDPDAGARVVGRGVEGHAVRAIAVDPRDARVAYVGCGLRGWGLYRTGDAGRTYTCVGFSDRWVWEVAWQPGAPGTLWVGTEPPMLYVSRDGGATFQACDGVERLPGRGRWRFFHPPFYAGHLHGLAFHPARPERIFAGVEHGALIYSHDGGATWHEALPGHDLHRLAVDPADPDRVLAGAGEGLFVSEDAGRTWRAVPALRGKYVHGLVFDPARPERAYAYADDAASPLYRSDDGGRTWQPVGAGLPAHGPADTLCLHPEDSGTVLYAAGRGPETALYVSPDGGGTWLRYPLPLPRIWRMRAAVD